MMGKKVEKVTGDDLEQARAALAQGHAELTRLKEAFLDGRDDVEWAQVKSQEGVVEYAAAEIERLARAKARYEESLRQSDLGKLRTEMDTYATAEGDVFADLLKQVEVAAVAFAGAYVDHNRTVSGWRERMTAGGIKPIGNRLSPAADAQGLSFSDNGAVRAGTREFQQEFSGQVLQDLLQALRGHDGIGAEYFTSEFVGHPKLEDLYARVSAPAQESPGISDDAVFYRHRNGTVHMRGAGLEIPAEDLRRLELTPISRDEALA
jgi:hypothetical protein